MIEQYEAIRLGIPDGMPIAVLHIGDQQSYVAAGTGAEPSTVITLAVGSLITAIEYFQHDPPKPVEIENAIIAVEDAVETARTKIPPGATLFSMDEAVYKIALISGVPDGTELILNRELIERTFWRLVAVSLGRPASREQIPANAEFAATLLILREFMHHLQFLSINVKA